MHTRGERRSTKIKKWKSKLRKLWWSNFLFERIRKVKSDGSINYNNLPRAESWKDYEKDKFGVKLKNTRTICSDKWLDDQEVHKRNLANKTLSKEDKEELDEAIELMDNPWSFENYCEACDYFGTTSCPHLETNPRTRWKDLNYDCFWD